MFENLISMAIHIIAVQEERGPRTRNRISSTSSSIFAVTNDSLNHVIAQRTLKMNDNTINNYSHKQEVQFSTGIFHPSFYRTSILPKIITPGKKIRGKKNYRTNL